MFDQPVESGKILSFCSSHSAPPTKSRFYTNDGFNILSAGIMSGVVTFSINAEE